MRLIDADALIPKGTKVTNDVMVIHDAITKAPIIDAVPVVRCKDCKFYNTRNHHMICEMHSEIPDQYGSGFDMQMLPDNFCSYGEQKGG